MTSSLSTTSRRKNGEGTTPKWDPARECFAMQITLNGKRVTLRDKDASALLLKAQTAIVDAARGLPQPSNKHTLRSYLKEWIAGARQDRERRPRTLIQYGNSVDHISASKVGGIRLGKFGPQDVQSLLREMRAKGLAENTVRLVHATLRVALGDAVELGLLPRNVAQVSRRKGRKRGAQEPAKPIRPLDGDQIEALRQAASGERLDALFIVAVVLGLRRGELLGLRWPDIDFPRRQIHVRWQLAEGEDASGKRMLDFEPLKTRGSRRTVDMPDVVLDALLAHRDRQAFEHQNALNLWQDRDLVFCSEFGNGIETTTLYRIWDRVRTAAGFKQRFHDLRHTAASQMLAQGGELWEISKVLGHSSYQLTVDTYGHLYQQTRRAVADRMDAVFMHPKASN